MVATRVGKRIPIPGLQKMIPKCGLPIPKCFRFNPYPNPKTFQIQSQSFQNSILIPKFEPVLTQSQEIHGMSIPKILSWKTSQIPKAIPKSWKIDSNPIILKNPAQKFGIGTGIPWSPIWDAYSHDLDWFIGILKIPKWKLKLNWNMELKEIRSDRGFDQF